MPVLLVCVRACMCMTLCVYDPACVAHQPCVAIDRLGDLPSSDFCSHSLKLGPLVCHLFCALFLNLLYLFVLGITMATALAHAGMTTWMKLEEANPRVLELVSSHYYGSTGRGYFILPNSIYL